MEPRWKGGFASMLLKEEKVYKRHVPHPFPEKCSRPFGGSSSRLRIKVTR